MPGSRVSRRRRDVPLRLGEHDRDGDGPHPRRRRTSAPSARSTTAAAPARRRSRTRRSPIENGARRRRGRVARAQPLVGRPAVGEPAARRGQDQFERPYGIVRPVDGMALHTRFWIEKYGWTPGGSSGRVADQQRAARPPQPAGADAKPMTMDDYLASRLIADPLRLFDCCLETDGAMAMVLTTAERAADLDVTPAYVTGFGDGLGPADDGDDVLLRRRAGGDAGALRRPGALAQHRPARRTTSTSSSSTTPSRRRSRSASRSTASAARARAPAYMAPGDAPAVQHQRRRAVARRTCTASTCWSRACARCAAPRRLRSTNVRHSLVTSGNVVPTGAIVFSKEPW